MTVPASINASKTNLAEFASQVRPSLPSLHPTLTLTRLQMTCFFWFESTELLNSIAECNPPASPSSPLRPLARHAVSPVDFMRWVATVLSTTQVSLNVVLLALLFVHRLKRLNPTVQGRPGSQYRLFTVALMLGNKCVFFRSLACSLPH